jgi:hypothetical protein
MLINENQRVEHLLPVSLKTFVEKEVYNFIELIISKILIIILLEMHLAGGK